MNEDQFTIHINPVYKKFYGNGNFGIYAVNVTSESPSQDRISEIDELFREIILVGVMPELETGALYVTEVGKKIHPKFGIQYEASTIYKKPLSTREEQKTFLGALITERQLNKICSAYPSENLIDLIEDDKLDVSLIDGVGERTYSKIKEKIKESRKYETAIIELGKFGLNYKSISALSDKYGSPDLLIQKVNENPYILTELDGYGFKRVDDIALALGVPLTSKYRIMACIEFILESQANNSGHAWMKKTKAISEAIKLLNIKISDIDVVLTEYNEKEFFVVDQINNRIYMKKYYKYENEIAQNLKRLLESENEYKIDDIEKAIEEVELEQGFKFTEEQVKAIHLAIESNVLVTVGKAGTGKTTAIRGIIKVLKKIEGLEYATCALSGKASQRIKEATGLDSYTIHRLLGYGRLGFTYDIDNPMQYDIIILDEASMVNSYLFYCIVRAMKNGAKLIICGDDAQLEPIGVGNVLVDLLNSNYVPSVEYTIVHRQAQRSGILSCANMVREGKRFISSDNYKGRRIGELKDLYMHPFQDSDDVFDKVISIAKQYNEDIMDFQVLTLMKNRGKVCVRSINKELQIIFNQDPENVDKKRKIERITGGKKTAFLEGDKVIINGNHPDKGIFNGTMGIIEYIDSEKDKKGEIVIQFEEVGRISFTESEMISIDLGYCISVHKSQGSGWKYVVLALDYSSYVLLNRQSTYTGMTRAIDALFMAVELKALQHSINTDNSSKRNTFLLEILKSF